MQLDRLNRKLRRIVIRLGPSAHREGMGLNRPDAIPISSKQVFYPDRIKRYLSGLNVPVPPKSRNRASLSMIVMNTETLPRENVWRRTLLPRLSVQERKSVEPRHSLSTHRRYATPVFDS